MENSHRYFENRDCEYFPCHKITGDFNCLFCFCPMYGKKVCPGAPRYIEREGRSIKDCTQCTYPHLPQHYDDIMAVLKRGDFLN